MNELKIELVLEYELKNETKTGIQQLLMHCFEDYPDGRTYINSIPHFRVFLVDNKQILGHCACHIRQVSNGERFIEIIGISDFCIHPSFRHKGNGGKILTYIRDKFSDSTYEFLVCFSAENHFYETHGFKVLDVPCKWLSVLQNQSLGIFHRKLNNMIFVHSLGNNTSWKGKLIDLIGPIF